MTAAVFSIQRPTVRMLRRRGRRVVRRLVVRPLRRIVALAHVLSRSPVREPRLGRLLSTALAGSGRVLVIGPAAAVRRARLHVPLDVVGTDPLDPEVSVVSEAVDEGSLPRRWDRVVVTDVEATHGRRRAAVGSCLPGGTVVVVTRRRTALRLGDDVVEEQVSRRRGLALHVLRVPA